MEKSKIPMCEWVNTGSGSFPYWYDVSCLAVRVNVKKLARQGRFNINNCPYCGKLIDWKKAVK